MGKRKDKPSIDADHRQDELDFESSGPNGSLGRSSGALTPVSPETSEDAAPAGKTAEAGRLFRIPSLTFEDAWEAASDREAGATSMKRTRVKRLALVAGTVALAAALGALIGSAATSGLGRAPASAGVAAGDAPLKLAIERFEQELATLRAGMEKSAQELDNRTKRIAERLDRSEHAQAEPALKLAKIGEALERLERRGAQPAQAAAANPNPADVTGSTGEPRAAMPQHGPPIVSGWTLKSVRNGFALIEGRDGLIEIERGDVLPGIGRVEAIRKHEGRWVVITARGLIVDR